MSNINELTPINIPVNIDPTDENALYKVIDLSKHTLRKINEHERRISDLEDVPEILDDSISDELYSKRSIQAVEAYWSRSDAGYLYPRVIPDHIIIGVAFPAGTAALPSITQISDLNTGIWFPKADTLAISTAGVERVRLNVAGNLGLGMVPSDWRSDFIVFEIYDPGYGNCAIAVEEYYTHYIKNAYIDDSGDYKTVAGGFASRLTQGATVYNFGFSTYGGAPDTLTGAFWPGLTITSGETTVNAGLRSYNFIVNSDSVSNSLKVDGATGRIGCNTSAPFQNIGSDLVDLNSSYNGVHIKYSACATLILEGIADGGNGSPAHGSSRILFTDRFSGLNRKNIVIDSSWGGVGIASLNDDLTDKDTLATFTNSGAVFFPNLTSTDIVAEGYRFVLDAGGEMITVPLSAIGGTHNHDTVYLKLDGTNSPITGDVTWGTDKKIIFRDANQFIHSGSAGMMNFGALTGFRFNNPVGIGRDPAFLLDLLGNSISSNVVRISNQTAQTAFEFASSSNTASYSGLFSAYRSRGTLAAPSACSALDNVFKIDAYAYIAGGYRIGAGIYFEVGAAPGAGTYPCDIVLKQVPVGSTTLSEFLRFRNFELLMRMNNAYIRMGSSYNVGMCYDGTNMVFNSRLLGVGNYVFSGAGSVTVSSMSSAGFVKNTAAGLLSGGNTIAAGDLPPHSVTIGTIPKAATANTWANSLITETASTITVTGDLRVIKTGDVGRLALMNNVTTQANARSWGFTTNSGAWGNFHILESVDQGSDPLAGTARINIASGGAVSILSMTTAGFVKNTAAGLLSGGNTIASGDLPAHGVTIGTIPKSASANGWANSIITETATGIGIGVASPGSRLSVISGSGLTGRAFDVWFGSGNNIPFTIGINRSSGNAWIGWNAYQSTLDAQVYGVANAAAKIQATTAGIIFSVAPSGTADATISWLNAWTITSAGILQSFGAAIPVNASQATVTLADKGMVCGGLSLDRFSAAQFTSDNSTTAGYGTWISNNAYWDGTNWRQPRGDSVGSYMFTANFHKAFSWNYAAPNGVADATFTPTQIMWLSSAGTLTLTGTKIIQSDTGNLTLGTLADNGNILLSPHGTGTVNISYMTTAGFVKNSVAGVLSGGNTIASGDLPAHGVTVGTVPKAASANGWANSLITETAVGIGINQAVPATRLHIGLANNETSFISMDGISVYNSSETANAGACLRFVMRASGTAFAGIAAIASSADNSEIIFHTESSNVLSEKWRITAAGILQSTGAQTITTDTGSLTLGTGALNGNILLSPHGTGVVQINKDCQIVGSTIGTVYGLTQNAKIHYDATNLVFNSRLLGTGNFLFSGGLVGVGVIYNNIPKYPLQIDGTTSDPLRVMIHTESTTTDNLAGIGFGVDTIDQSAKSAIVHQRKASYGRGDLVFCLSNTASNTNIDINDEKMRLTRTGELGLGVAAPASLLEIRGGLTTVGSVLTLGTKEPTVVANDVLGRINFYAPLEASGTDAILTGASIAAVAEAEFTASVNATSLVFQTGASETATTKWSITSAGILRAAAAQTIDAPDTLTLATTALNGNILLSPHGTGGVGIGVTPQAWASTYRALQIGALGAIASPVSVSTAGGTILSQNYFWDGTNEKTYNPNSHGCSYFSMYDGVFTWWSAPAQVAGNVTPTQKMQLDISGNLGLGVTPQTWTNFKAMQIGAYGSIFSTAATGAGGGIYMAHNVYYDGANKTFNTTSDESSMFYMSNGAFYWSSAVEQVAGAVALLPKMHIDIDGALTVFNRDILFQGTPSGSGFLFTWDNGNRTIIRATDPASDSTGSEITFQCNWLDALSASTTHTPLQIGYDFTEGAGFVNIDGVLHASDRDILFQGNPSGSGFLFTWDNGNSTTIRATDPASDSTGSEITFQCNWLDALSASSTHTPLQIGYDFTNSRGFMNVDGKLNINIANVPAYATETAAVAGGLVAGDVYRLDGDDYALLAIVVGS